MMFAPLEGWRHVKVTDRCAAVDYAHALKDLSDTHFPDADKIVLVQDNLSTLAALSTQCLDRRILNKPELTAEVAAWEQRRNKHHAKADWQFTTVDVRVKLARLYPQFA